MDSVSSRPQRVQNRYVRFTSNVLRSAGIVNDAICFILAFMITRLIYGEYYGYFYEFRLHETAGIVMAINFFLIRISRDAYSAFRGQATIWAAARSSISWSPRC